MKKLLFLCICFFYSYGYTQELKGNYLVTKLASMPNYFIIYLKDSTGKEIVALSSVFVKDTTACKKQRIEVGKYYYLNLHEQRFICIRPEENLYIDLLDIDHVDGVNINKYKLPFTARQFVKLSYCPCLTDSASKL